MEDQAPTEWNRLRVSTRPTPEPINKENEIAALQLLLDLLEANPTDPRLDELEAICEVTPWMAFQLGCLAESDQYEDVPFIRQRLAILAVEAALVAKAPDRYFANLLTYGNLLAYRGDLDEAEKIYRHILVVPLPCGEDERAAAHLVLGQGMERCPELQIFHYEMAIKTHGGHIPKDVRRELAQNAGQAYAALQDLAGALHMSIETGEGDPDELLKQVLPQLSLEAAVALATRLSGLGHGELAQKIRDDWKKERN